MPSILRSLTKPLLKTFSPDGTASAPKVKGFACHQRAVETFFDLRDLVKEAAEHSHKALSLSIPRGGDFASNARNATTMAIEAMSNVVWVDLDTEVPGFVGTKPQDLAAWAQGLVYPKWGVCGLVIIHSQSSLVHGRGRRVHIAALTSRPVTLEVRQQLSAAVGGDPSIYSVAQMIFVGNPIIQGSSERIKLRVQVVPPRYDENTDRRESGADWDFVDVDSAPCLIGTDTTRVETQPADTAERADHWIDFLVAEGNELQLSESARSVGYGTGSLQESIAHFLEMTNEPLPTIVEEYENYLRDGYNCGYVKITRMGGRKRRPYAEGVSAGEWDSVFNFTPELVARLELDKQLSAKARPIRQMAGYVRKLASHFLTTRKHNKHVNRRFLLIRKLAYGVGRGYSMPVNDRGTLTNYRRPELEQVVELLQLLVYLLVVDAQHLETAGSMIVTHGAGLDAAHAALKALCTEEQLKEADEFQNLAYDAFFAGLATGVASYQYDREKAKETGGSGRNKRAVEADAMNRMEMIMSSKTGERQAVAYRQLRWADRQVRAGNLPVEVMATMMDIVQMKFRGDADHADIIADFERRFRPREGLFKKVKRIGKTLSDYMTRVITGCYRRLVDEHLRGQLPTRPVLV